MTNLRGLLPALMLALLAAPAWGADFTFPPAALPKPIPYQANPFPVAGLEAFVDAINVKVLAGRQIDSFWQPAITELVAANPAQPEKARAFGQAWRDAELAVYRPLVLLTLGKNAPNLADTSLDAKIANLA